MYEESIFIPCFIDEVSDKQIHIYGIDKNNGQELCYIIKPERLVFGHAVTSYIAYGKVVDDNTRNSTSEFTVLQQQEIPIYYYEDGSKFAISLNGGSKIGNLFNLKGVISNSYYSQTLSSITEIEYLFDKNYVKRHAKIKVIRTNQIPQFKKQFGYETYPELTKMLKKYRKYIYRDLPAYEKLNVI